MPDRKTLEALLVRVEGAGGEDRELDALIFAEFDNRDVRYANGMLLAKSRRVPHDECVLGFVDPGKVQRNFSWRGQFPVDALPDVTSSIDAALALTERLLPDWQCIYISSEWTGIKRPGNGVAHHCTLRRSLHSYVTAESKNRPTAPLAILAALLTALMQTQDENV